MFNKIITVQENKKTLVPFCIYHSAIVAGFKKAIADECNKKLLMC